MVLVWWEMPFILKPGQPFTVPIRMFNEVRGSAPQHVRAELRDYHTKEIIDAFDVDVPSGGEEYTHELHGQMPTQENLQLKEGHLYYAKIFWLLIYKNFNTNYDSQVPWEISTATQLNIEVGEHGGDTPLGGTVSPEIGSYVLEPNVNVIVTALPDDDHRFWKWVINENPYSGGQTIYDNPITMLMNQKNIDLKAYFTFNLGTEPIEPGSQPPITEYILTVINKSSQQMPEDRQLGFIGSTEPGEGPHNYPVNENVTVTASAYAGYEFDSWIIDSGFVSKTNPAIIKMDSNHTIEAVFKKAFTPEPPETPTEPPPEGTPPEEPILTAKGQIECHSYLASIENSVQVEIIDVGTFATPFTVTLNPGTYSLQTVYKNKIKGLTVEVIGGATTLVKINLGTTPPPTLITPPTTSPILLVAAAGIIIVWMLI